MNGKEILEKLLENYKLADANVWSYYNESCDFYNSVKCMMQDCGEIEKEIYAKQKKAENICEMTGRRIINILKRKSNLRGLLKEIYFNNSESEYLHISDESILIYGIKIYVGIDSCGGRYFVIEE